MPGAFKFIGRLSFALTLLALTCLPALSQPSSTDKLEVIPNAGLSGGGQALAFSPDDRWIVSGSADGAIQLWDRASGRQLRAMRAMSAQTDAIKGVQVALDGKLVASESLFGAMNIWDSSSGKLVRRLADIRADSDAGPGGLLVGRPSLSADGRFVYTADTHTIRRIGIATGKIERILFSPAYLEAFTVAPDERLIAIVGEQSSPQKSEFPIDLVDSRTGKVRHLGTYLQRNGPDVDNMVFDTYIKTIAFSADGKRLVVAAATRLSPSNDFRGEAQVFDVASGRSMFTVVDTVTSTDWTQNIDQAGFSPDARRLVTAGVGGLKFWDPDTGKQLFRLDGTQNPPVRVFVYSHDGRIIATEHSSPQAHTLTIRDAETGTPLPVAVGQADTDAPAISALDDGRWLGVDKHSMAIWDPSTWQLSQMLKSKPGEVKVSSQYQAKDTLGRTQVLTADEDALALKLWDPHSGRLIRTFEWDKFRKADKPCETCANYHISRFALSPDGRWVAGMLYGDGGIIKLWDAGGGRLVYNFSLSHPNTGPTDDGSDGLVFSKDGSELFAVNTDASANTYLSRWNVDTGRLQSSSRLSSTFGVDLATLADPALSPDGRRIAGGYGIFAKGTSFNMKWTVALFDPATARVVKAFSAPGVSDSVAEIRFSGDGRYLFVATLEGRVNQWDVSSGRLVRSFDCGTGEISSIELSNDETQLVAGARNGTTTVFNVATGEHLVTTLHAKSGEWVSITPEGFFSASTKGAELLHVVRGFETIGIDQVYQPLYRPDLVREKLAGDPRGLVRTAAAQLDLNKVVSSGTAPDVRLTLPGRALGPASIDSNTTTLSAEAVVTDRGGGIGRVEWRVNGVTVGIDDPPSATGAQSVRLARSLLLDPGDNAVEIVAYNRANLIASSPARINVAAQVGGAAGTQPGIATPPQAPPVAAARPRLFALVAGINSYADNRIKLTYAVSDATDVARGFREAADGFYQSADLKLMTDAEVTRDKLDAAFAEIAKKAQPSDVFVLYLAGHGKTVDGRYYFIPEDFTIDGEMSKSSIDASVKAKAISQEQLQRWFALIPARKSVILFDTCDSGTLTGDAGETQRLEKGAANDRLAQATGRSIITASGGSQEAIEGYHGHGLFTYELLDALDHADSDRSGTVEITELAAFVYAQVSELSLKVFKQRQAPQMRIATNYPLAKQTRVLADETVPVAASKPGYQVSQAAQLQIEPGSGATVVRSLGSSTAVEVLASKDGWSLVAVDGRPLGYVATRDLAPIQ